MWTGLLLSEFFFQNSCLQMLTNICCITNITVVVIVVVVIVVVKLLRAVEYNK